MSTTKVHLETPLLRATRLFLYEVDATKRLPNGKKVGNDKYKVEGFFDPASDDGKAFLRSVIAYLKTTGLDQDEAVAAAKLSLPTNAERATPIGGIPEGWRRILANTAYGPVSAVRADGKPPTAAELFPGVWVRADVTPNAFEDPKTGDNRVSFWLNSVFLEKPGDRLFGANAASTFGKYIKGGTSSRAVLDDADDADIPF